MPAHLTIRQTLTAFTRGELQCAQAARAAVQAARNSNALFTRINENAVAHAEAMDAARARGEAPALAGLPLSVKDLFDVRGECTLAGSVVLRHEARAARADAEVVANLRAAGAVFIGRANMSEFAFSGMGLNPHYGDAKCVWDRATGRLPGGSSSGSAVAIAEGIVAASVGSDTAGSCRTPAAFNGIVGVKPSFGRMPARGMYPLSPSSDVAGPLANDVDGCFLLDKAMRGKLRAGELPALHAAESFRLAVPRAKVTAELDAEVEAAFARALQWLARAGVEVTHAEISALDDCIEMFATRAVAVFEAWQAHKERLQKCGGEYDAYVRRRISSGRDFDADARAACYREKAELVVQCARQMQTARADALVYPTVMCIPPAMAEVNLDAMPRINFRCLRNTSTVNFFDGCAVSLPCHLPGEPPVGLMLAAGNGGDARLYRIAAAVEEVLRGEGVSFGGA